MKSPWHVRASNQPSGIVVFDTNCLKFLEDRSERAMITRSLAAVDFEIWPTAINAIEIASNQNPDIRRRALTILSALAGEKGLLPLPEHILRKAGQAIVQGQPGFWSGRSGLEPMLEHPGNVSEEVRRAAAKFRQDLEERFDAMHRRARPVIRGFLKRQSGADRWGSAAEFLDGQWTKALQQDDFLRGIWTKLGLQGDAPVEALLVHPVWRLLIELEGIAVFERTVVAEQPKRVQHADLLQLLYLSSGRKALLVTEDRPLRRAARAVLDGRYAMTRVLTWSEFRASQC